MSYANLLVVCTILYKVRTSIGGAEQNHATSN